MVPKIYIHKGDSVVFADTSKFLTFIIETEINTTGWIAEFHLDKVFKRINLVDNSFEVTLSANQTAKLPLGSICGEVVLFDSEGNRKTVATNIPFEVTGKVIQNQPSTVTLTIPKGQSHKIFLSVGLDYVSSINNKTGDVVLDYSDVNALPDTTFIPEKTSDLVNDSDFTTNEKLELGLYTKQDKGNYIEETEFENNKVYTQGLISEVDERVNALDNKKANIDYVDDELALKADKADLNTKANISDIPTKVSQLVNDEGYLTEHQDISNKADIDYVEELLDRKSDKADTYTKVEVNTLIDDVNDNIELKQDKLTAGENIIIDENNVISSIGSTLVGVTSVNGKTGDVALTAQDVGALPDTTVIPDIPDLTDYVKNTDYATMNTAGVIKVNPTLGTTINTSGVLNVAIATNDEIIARTNNRKPIVPNTLNLAVKEGVTTNTIELTEDEKASAKNWLGFATPTEIMQAIASIPQFSISIVEALPETGEKMTLYLVSKGTESPDVYDEYIWIEETSSFEFLGTTAVDLTDYVKKTDYAQGANAGVIKVGKSLGTSTSSGYINCLSKTLEDYKNDSSTTIYSFISKGTLENIKDDYVKRGLTENSIEFSDEEKTSARTLIGAVGNTDYAGNTGGVIKSSVTYSTKMNSGFLTAVSETLDNYNVRPNASFVSKGTLENIKDDFIKRGLTENTLELTDDEKTSARTLIGAGSQADLDTKADDSDVVHKTGAETITGVKTFTIPDNIKFTASKTAGYKPGISNAQSGLTPAINVPWSRNGWHDHFAFGQSFTIASKEVTTDGESWVADDRDISYLFAQKEYGATGETVQAPNAGEMGFRFVLQGSNIAYSNIQWIEIGFSYSSAHTVRLLVESSSDGTEWTEVHNSTTSASANYQYLYVGNLSSGNTYLRISVIKVDTSSLDVVTRMLYVKGWTYRKGNQGRGIEYEYPYFWDNIPNLMPVKSGNNLGSTTRRWGTTYTTNLNVGGQVLNHTHITKLNNLPTISDPMTQSEYDALTTKDANTLYLIEE